jgi:3-oxoacyl-[acyl-carrier-protein] synthase II
MLAWSQATIFPSAAPIAQSLLSVLSSRSSGLFMSRRVVITGIGVVSPLGSSAEAVWQALAHGSSGVRELTLIPPDGFPIRYGAEARQFTGAIEDFGPLDKGMARTIKKNLKVMCREMQLGIAAAQLALTDCQLPLAAANLDRVGCVYGSDYMLTLPQEFTTAMRNCLDETGRFQFTEWAEKGLPAVEPLWLLKYLPNLPAAHIAIFNDLRGPNNSLTMREASGYLAIGEAWQTIVRGHADCMLAGATGTKVHPARTIHVVTQEEVAVGDSPPETLSRPFDRDRAGAVLGEGAAALMLEELEHAQMRGAKILGEVVGAASSAVSDRRGGADYVTGFTNVLQKTLAAGRLSPGDLGHVNAHGLSTRRSDAEEALAIATVFGDRRSAVPVVAAKSYFGNLGAASGIVELVGSVMALQHGRLFRTLNYETPDPECPVKPVTREDVPSGDSFIALSMTPQGQASAVAVRRFT